MAAYLLIHGGASTARFWDRVVARLGDEAVAIDLPGRGSRPGDLATFTLDGAAASVVADLEAAVPEGPVVVVAHSSGGLVAPRVVDALGERVAHVLLSSASVPPSGGTGLDCMKPRHREHVVPVVEAARAEGRTVLVPVPGDPEALRESYGERLDDATLAFVADPVRLVEDSFEVYFQPVDWWTVTAPITYLRAERDRAVPVDLQDEMIRRLPGRPTVVSWDCGHIPAVTRPDEFAALVRGLA